MESKNPSTQNSEPRTQNSPPTENSLTPDLLQQKLESSPNLSAQSLQSQFHCSLPDLTAALANGDFLTRNKIDTQLAFLQSRAVARRYVSHALVKTVTLMNEAEKPEVARRAASALIQIAGLPIRTAPQPAPLLFPEPTAGESDNNNGVPDGVDPTDPDVQDLLAATAFVLGMKRSTGVDISAIPDEYMRPLAEVIRAFLKKNNLPWSWGIMAPPDDNDLNYIGEEEDDTPDAPSQPKP